MKTWVAIVLLLTPFTLHAADCTNANIDPSTDEAVNFSASDNGTVTDNSTHLMWMRCSLGQTWSNDASCNGTALTYTWSKALSAGTNFSFGGYSDWRLPNINELRSIIEDCRNSPAINSQLFPQTPSSKFWSSSPYIATSTTNAWVVDFTQGRDNFDLKTKANAVRLVRINK
jgi:hypothetical protein